MLQAKSLALSLLPKGTPAKIVQIRSQGELGRRIRDMGFVPGRSVTVLGRAPLGDPLALRIADSTVALRKKEAATIIINF